jgi:P-type Ca2+ transporter type 2C
MAFQNNMYYQLTAEETIKRLGSRKEGLAKNEIEQRLRFYGPNKLLAVNRESFFLKFLYQFKDLLAIILIVAGAFSIYLQSYRDATIMFTIVLINSLIGFIQEYKAEKVMESLKSMVRARAKVIRDEKTTEIEAENLVPGDIVMLEEGDAIPADVRLIEENTLAANDFSLTGESDPVRKFTHAMEGVADLGDRNNLAFMGTTIATGNGKGIVVATGMQTEIGRIANLSIQTEDEPSPLQKELNYLAKKITFIAIIVGLILFCVGFLLHFSIRESFLFAMGIATSCVPEGLPAQVSVALSLAAGRLAQKKAVIKKLSAVETLGSTHIICTDKTGTLTTNEMTVQKLLIGNKEYDVTGIGYETKGQILFNGGALSAGEIKKLQLFFENGVFASNARVCPPDKMHKNWYAIGDPTEAALITLSAKAGIDQKELDKKYPELKEFTFDAVRKRMSSIRSRNGRTFVYAKGAPLNIVQRCTHLWDGENVRPITETDKQSIRKKIDDFAMLALRNLGYAYKEIPSYDPNCKMDETENNLIWLGVVSMIDPPRKEVKAAIESAIKAYVRVIIITGDYALTAEAIARKIGMGSGKNKNVTVVTGKELHNMSDIDLLNKLICNNLIFARTSPEDKLRVVDLLKRAGEIVAVTGDGVNDAPALKRADIGVAMGKTGTEVAKDSSELVLLDDSFSTLVTAIHEGRNIFQNLRKTIMSTLTSNGAELFAVLFSLAGASLYGAPLAILAVQILAIDLIGEMLPLTFLTWDPPISKIMTEPPRNPNQHILNEKTLFNIAWCGFIMGALSYFNFLFLFAREGVSVTGISSDNPLYMRATILTFVTIVFCQWTNILSRRAGDTESVFTSYLWSNKRLLLSYGLSLLFMLNIVYNPYVAPFLYAAPMKIMDWIYAIIAAIIYLLIRESYKMAVRFQLKKAIA